MTTWIRPLPTNVAAFFFPPGDDELDDILSWLGLPPLQRERPEGSGVETIKFSAENPLLVDEEWTWVKEMLDILTGGRVRSEWGLRMVVVPDKSTLDVLLGVLGLGALRCHVSGFAYPDEQYGVAVAPTHDPETLPHELTHLLLQQYFPEQRMMPSWVTEGMAFLVARLRLQGYEPGQETATITIPGNFNRVFRRPFEDLLTWVFGTGRNFTAMYHREAPDVAKAAASLMILFIFRLGVLDRFLVRYLTEVTRQGMSGEVDILSILMELTDLSREDLIRRWTDLENEVQGADGLIELRIIAAAPPRVVRPEVESVLARVQAELQRGREEGVRAEGIGLA